MDIPDLWCILCVRQLKDILRGIRVEERSFIVSLLAEFASAYKLKQKQAFNYLNRFKGIQFLHKHYEVLHTQSFEDVIESLVMVCRNNGGQLA